MRYSTLSTLFAIAVTTATASPIDAIDPFLLEQAIEYKLAKRNAEAIGDSHVNFDKAPSLIEPWWNFPHMIIGQQKGNTKRNAIPAQNNLLFEPTIGAPEPWWQGVCPKGSIWSTEDRACTSPHNHQKKKKRDPLAKKSFLPKPTIGHPEWWRNIDPIPVNHLPGIILNSKKRNAKHPAVQQNKNRRTTIVGIEQWISRAHVSPELWDRIFANSKIHPQK